MNFSYPVDISRKRRWGSTWPPAEGRDRVQLQDSARNLIDDLYTAYVNALAARETLRFGEAFLAGISALLEKSEREARDETDKEKKETKEESVHALRDQVNQARFQVRRAPRPTRGPGGKLGQILDLPADQSERMELRGLLREPSPGAPATHRPGPAGLAARPDLVAYRLGLGRARAEVGLALPSGIRMFTSFISPTRSRTTARSGSRGRIPTPWWANAVLPISNRNQGNIRLAEWGT